MQQALRLLSYKAAHRARTEDPLCEEGICRSTRKRRRSNRLKSEGLVDDAAFAQSVDRKSHGIQAARRLGSEIGIRRKRRGARPVN